MLICEARTIFSSGARVAPPILRINHRHPIKFTRNIVGVAQPQEEEGEARVEGQPLVAIATPTIFRTRRALRQSLLRKIGGATRSGGECLAGAALPLVPAYHLRPPFLDIPGKCPIVSSALMYH